MRLEGPAGTPQTVLLKRPAAGRADRGGESLALETRFYRELSHRIGARTPRYLGSGVEPGTRRPYLLLEDLGPLPPTDWRAGPTVEHARQAVEALARVHASGFAQGDTLGWIPSFADPALLAAFEDAYARGWSKRRDFFAAIVPAFVESGDALLGRIAASHAALAEAPTLLHGDAHAENLPLVDGEVVLLDWAGPRLGSCGLDLGFFVAMSFPPERRRVLERELVSHHAETLAARGTTPGLDPWLGYRRGVLRRVTRIVGMSETWPSAAAAALRMIFERSATAAVELRVGDLL